MRSTGRVASVVRVKATVRVMVTAMLVLSGCASAGVARGALAVSTAMLVCDGIQTGRWSANGWMTSRGAPFEEANPVLGKHPSVSKVELYFVGAIALNALAWALSPKRYRAVVPLAVMAAQAKPIAGNVSLGSGVCGIGGDMHGDWNRP